MLNRRLFSAASLAAACTALASAALVAGPGPARAQAPAPEVKPAAADWLKLTDAGEHATAWSRTAAAFRKAVSATQWQQAAESVRKPLGAVLARQDKTTSFTRSLPGAPDGQYAVLQFNTRFENKADAVETVTAVLEADGTWRVVGYFIR